MSLRVLVVDDHEPWRREISSLLEPSRGWEVVGEAADGVEAIQKASALEPDLILLDVELPVMTGIEAAKKILAVTPGAKILFVSAHQTWDIVEAAFTTGARGYVVKPDAGHDLLPAMRAIVEGKRFVSATLTGRSVDGTTERPRHVVGFYSDDSRLVEAHTRFANAALAAGRTLIFVAVESRRDEVHRRLQALGVDVDRARREHRLLWVDVPHTLSSFMVDGRPDEERLWKAATSLIARAAAAARCKPPAVALCGDGCATLLNEGSAEAAIRLEQLWNEVATTFNVDVFCPYPRAIAHDEKSPVIQRICEAHTAVLSS